MVDFQTFFHNLNSFHPTIKYEYTISETSTDYLDLTIYKGQQFETTRKLYNQNPFLTNQLFSVRPLQQPSPTQHKSSYHQR